MKVKDITSKISAASDKIPVTIRRGFETIGTSKSLTDLGNSNASGVENILESTITFFTIKKDGITIQVK